MTSAGLESATFRLVPQRLIYLRYCVILFYTVTSYVRIQQDLNSIRECQATRQVGSVDKDSVLHSTICYVTDNITGHPKGS